MSSSRRSSICSDLFTREGITGRSSQQTPGQHTTTSTSNETSVVRISLDNVKTWLRRLADSGDIQIDRLGPSLTADFTNMVEITNLSSTTGHTQVILKLIDEAFSSYRRGHITPGTVAAYFKGCTVGDDFGGEPGCSAVCAGMFQPDVIPGWVPCQENVVHLRDGKLSFQNIAKGESRATVHIFDAGIRGFTPAQIKALRDEGISRVAVYHHGTGDYTVKQNHVDIDRLPTLGGGSNQGQLRQVQRGTPEKRTTRTPTPTSTDYTWVLWLVLVVVVVLAIYAYYRNRQ